MKDGLVAEGKLSLKYAPELTIQGISTGRQALLDASYINYAQAITGVRTVVPRIWGYGNIGNTLLVVVGIDQQYASLFNLTSAYPIKSGTFLDPNSDDSIVIGEAVADLLRADVGSVLSILTESNNARQYTVAGIFDSESSIYNGDMILMNFDETRTFFLSPPLSCN